MYDLYEDEHLFPVALRGEWAVFEDWSTGDIWYTYLFTDGPLLAEAMRSTMVVVMRVNAQGVCVSQRTVTNVAYDLEVSELRSWPVTQAEHEAFHGASH